MSQWQGLAGTYTHPDIAQVIWIVVVEEVVGVGVVVVVGGAGSTVRVPIIFHKWIWQ